MTSRMSERGDAGRLWHRGAGRRVERRRACSPSASVWSATRWCRGGFTGAEIARSRHAPRTGDGAPGRGVRRRRAHGRDRRHAHGRCPLVYDEAFLALAAHAGVLALCRELLGDYVILMQQNGVINPSGQAHTQLAYHRDLPYQHFVSSRPLAISALVLHRSVHDRDRRHHGDSRLASHGDVSVRCRGGGARHRLSAPSRDRSSSSTRWCSTAPARTVPAGRAARVNQVFSTPIIAQQISLPDALDGKYAGDPVLARLLGYDVAPSRSVTAWRERRLARQRSASARAAADKRS